MREHLASLVEDFRRHGNETAIVLHRGNRAFRTSYREVAVLAGRFAAELERRGIEPGERVVLWGENSAEWVSAFFGCLLRGIVAVPLDAAGSSAFADRVIADTAPRLIAGDAALLSTLETRTPQLFFTVFRQSLPERALFDVRAGVTAETPFQIVFTSGTTSDPKGIVHTHRNVLASLGPIENEIARYRRYERLVHPLRFLQTLPLSHVFGQFVGLYVPSLLAAEVHFDARLDPARMIEEIHRERISVLIAVPRVLHLLCAHLLGRFPELAQELAASGGFSVWRRWWRFRRAHRALGLKFWAFLCGGASLPADLERFWTTLGFALIQGYGMTETAALVTLNHPFRISRGSIGRALPGRELRLENGEILVRGEMLSAATWQSGEMKPREEEWFATGDLAEQNQEGELRFVGRKDDVIVTASGMNIHPSDLESAVESQKGVRGCIVVSCQIAGGAEPVAVVLLSGSDGELQAVIRAANEQLADFQQIRRFLRWPEPGFPYTFTGKLLRRRVSDWACATLASDRQSEDRIAGEKDALLEVIASVTGETIPRGDDGRRLTEELHLDSIARVQLQSALEQKFAIEIPDDAMAEIETLGELRALAEHASRDDRKPSPASTSRHDATEQSEPQTTTDAPRGEAREHVSPPADEHVYPHWPWAAPIRFVRVLFVEFVLRPLVWLLAAPRVVWDFTGLPAGPFLLIANHVTAYDGALILYALPARLRRRVAIAMSGEMLLDLRKGRKQGSYWKNAAGPLSYWLLTGLFNTFPLPRLRGFRRSFAHAGQALDRGDSVLIFPEGHRSPDGRMQPFRAGIGMLAHDSQVQVLPIALIGLEEMRASGHWFRSGRLCIRIGNPIGIGEATDPAALTLRLEEAVGRLVGQSPSTGD